MRFLTPHGIGEIRGSQFEERTCHFVAMKEVRYTEVSPVKTEFPSSMNLINTKELGLENLVLNSWNQVYRIDSQPKLYKKKNEIME